MNLNPKHIVFFLRYGIISGFSLIFVSCHPGPKPTIIVKDAISNIPGPDSTEIPDSARHTHTLTVKLDAADSVENYDLDEHLFGKFFGDRASFYIIKDPNNRINGIKVKSMTLFYLDGTLFKTKYVLEKNIADYLINNYPQFTLRGFDLKNRDLMNREKIFYKKNRKWSLNPGLDNYEIIWRLGRNEMIMRVNENDPEMAYQYTVNDKNYKKILYTIENSAYFSNPR